LVIDLDAILPPPHILTPCQYDNAVIYNLRPLDVQVDSVKAYYPGCHP
jgi:hypothetical protein